MDGFDKGGVLASRSFFSELFGRNETPMIIVDRNSLKIIEANPAAVSFYEYSKAELCDIPFRDIDSRTASLIGRGSESLFTADISTVFEHRLRSGAVKIVRLASSSVLVDGCDLVFILVMEALPGWNSNPDVSNRLRDIIDTQSSLISVWRDGKLLDCNKKFIYFFNLTNAEEFTLKYPALMDILIDHKGCIPRGSWKDFIDEAGDKSNISFIAVIRPQDGDVRIFSIEIGKIESSRMYIISMFDVTDMGIKAFESNDDGIILNRTKIIEANDMAKVLQVQDQILLQQSKMAVMGEMIGVIAHQWKQPLSVINIIAQELMEIYDEGELDKELIVENLESILKQVSFMSDTVNGFLNFFKPSKNKEHIGILDIVSQTEELFAPQLKNADISINYSAPAGIKDVIVYWTANELKQVVMNFFVNSKDAIANYRTLTGKRFRGEINVSLELDGNFGIVRFNDNGGGIKEGYLDNVFDIYVTSKGDKGTGIGLYLCKALVTGMGGDIFATNRSNGAEFTLKLPIAKIVK